MFSQFLCYKRCQARWYYITDAFDLIHGVFEFNANCSGIGGYIDTTLITIYVTRRPRSYYFIFQWQDCFLLAIPPISKTCAASFFERSFIYAAPTLWNQLSIDIRMLEFNQFKSRVKTELYLKYFEP